MVCVYSAQYPKRRTVLAEQPRFHAFPVTRVLKLHRGGSEDGFHAFPVTRVLKLHRGGSEDRLPFLTLSIQGDYVRVYPTSDPIKGRLYSRLMEDSLTASGLGMYMCGLPSS